MWDPETYSKLRPFPGLFKECFYLGPKVVFLIFQNTFYRTRKTVTKEIYSVNTVNHAALVLRF
jgi:hypothetical protein